jgi:hypothetical protein
METIHLRAVVRPDGSLHIDDLPFAPGEEVEVTVTTQERPFQSSERASLENTVLNYIDPTSPVAEDDWEASR